MSLAWIGPELERLRSAGLLRVRSTPISTPGPRIRRGDRELVNLCSNDYLSLAAADVRGAAGSGASRLIVGDLAVHTEVERALADWLRVDSALLFSSGYAANVGAIAALADRDTLVVSDALNHASIVDGCRLSRARVVVTPHRAVDAVDAALAGAGEARKLVVTDAYFSMDGTLAPLAELRAVCDRRGAALYVDEAHALGVFGPEGRGACAAAGITPDVLVGTLGKAFGAAGAFVAGSAALGAWMWNRARSFVFSTGLSPSVAAAALAALPEVRAGARTARVLAHAASLRASLGERAASGSVGPVIPVVLGDPQLAVARAGALLELGIFVQAIRPPTVRSGTARLRITVQADHDERDLARAGEALRRVLG